MKRSGTQIAWDFFHKGEPTPWFISYVQDRDLWQWKLPDSKAVSECLWNDDWLRFIKVDCRRSKITIRLDKLDQLYQNFLKGDWNKDLDHMVKVGRELLITKEKEYIKFVRLSVLCEFKTPTTKYIIRAVNCPWEIRSEVANKILDLFDDHLFVIWWVYSLQKDLWICSLRSKVPAADSAGASASFNVASVAEEFGGGGHKTAAGMSIKGGSLRDYLTPI